tara:strand:- start:744 stop:2312 length:1569 start_codon:yes stop_codon:yes gene_type:complete
MSYVLNAESKSGQMLTIDTMAINKFIENTTNFDYPINSGLTTPQNQNIIMTPLEASIPFSFHNIIPETSTQLQNNLIPISYFDGVNTWEIDVPLGSFETIVIGGNPMKTMRGSYVNDEQFTIMFNNQFINSLNDQLLFYNQPNEMYFGAVLVPAATTLHISWTNIRRQWEFEWTRVGAETIEFNYTRQPVSSLSVLGDPTTYAPSGFPYGTNPPITHHQQLPYLDDLMGFDSVIGLKGEFHFPVLAFDYTNRIRTQINISTSKLKFIGNGKGENSPEAYPYMSPNNFCMFGHIKAITLKIEIGGISSIDGSTQDLTPMIARIPLKHSTQYNPASKDSASYGENIVLDNSSARHPIRLDSIILKSFRVKLVDDYGHAIDLNGCDWSMSLGFSFIQAPVNSQMLNNLKADDRRSFQAVPNPMGNEVSVLQDFQMRPTTISGRPVLQGQELLLSRQPILDSSGIRLDRVPVDLEMMKQNEEFKQKLNEEQKLEKEQLELVEAEEKIKIENKIKLEKSIKENFPRN